MSAIDNSIEYKVEQLNLGDITFSNGDEYIGEFKNNMFNGKGTLKYSDGKTQKGNFVNHKFQGK